MVDQYVETEKVLVLDSVREILLASMLIKGISDNEGSRKLQIQIDALIAWQQKKVAELEASFSNL